MADKPKKECFVVGPIGAADSEVRIHADWLLEEIINPVMAEFPEFVVHRADKLSQPGLIDTQVITHLLNDDLVIADITTLNPNAFYEIGIRHMSQKPIIHMHKHGEKIPFDIGAYRSIDFSLARPSDLRAGRESLKAAVDAVLADGYRVDNPVTHARGIVHIQEQATDSQRVLLDELRGVKDRLASLERSESVEKIYEQGFVPDLRGADDKRVFVFQSKSVPSQTEPWKENSLALVHLRKALETDPPTVEQMKQALNALKTIKKDET